MFTAVLGINADVILPLIAISSADASPRLTLPVTPKSPVIATLPPAKSTWNVVFVPSETVKSLLVTKVPPITVLPVADATVNLSVAISKSPLIEPVPPTFKLPDRATAPELPLKLMDAPTEGTDASSKVSTPPLMFTLFVRLYF